MKFFDQVLKHVSFDLSVGIILPLYALNIFIYKVFLYELKTVWRGVLTKNKMCNSEKDEREVPVTLPYVPLTEQTLCSTPPKRHHHDADLVMGYYEDGNVFHVIFRRESISKLNRDSLENIRSLH
ncbi:hypothetical protein TNCV_142461 [Trichonephila clavipes]|nr:hypothetical protein TNCV_142461 [Trichonephila clavipes]